MKKTDIFYTKSIKKNVSANYMSSLNLDKYEENVSMGVSTRFLSEKGKELYYFPGTFEENAGKVKEIARIFGDLRTVFTKNPEYIEDESDFEDVSLSRLRDMVQGIASKACALRYVSAIPYVDLSARRVEKEIFVDRKRFLKKYNEYSGFLYLKVEKDKDTQADGWFFNEKLFSQIDISGLIDKSYERAVKKIGARPIEPQVLPVILSNNVAADFINIIISMFDEKLVLKQKTPFLNDLNQEIAQKDLGIELLSGSGLFYSAPFDDEGVAHKNLEIIRSGVLTEYLRDRYTALLTHKPSNGFGFRSSYRADAARSSTNIIIKIPNIAWTDAFKYEKEVVLVADVSGLHTIDEITGDFSLGFEGFYYKNGKFVHPLNAMTIAGNIRDLLKNIIFGVGQETRIGNFYSPALLVKKMVIGS